MADAVTSTSSLGVDTAAYEKLAYYSYRPELYFGRIADVRPTDQTHNGSTVIFRKFDDIAVATTPLSETVDVDAVALSDGTTTVTLVEQGNAVLTTAKLRGTSMIEIDPIVANIIGFNAGVSMDTIPRDVLAAGTNVAYATGGADTPTARNTIDVDDELTASDVRVAVARLKGANVPTFGGMYVGFIHPDVALDLREETGAAAWRDPHVYSQPAEIWNGEIGAFEGVRFVESPRAPLFANASDGAGAGGTIDAYRTMILGRQSLAMAWSRMDGNGPSARVVLGPVTDKLRRFQPIGWYWLGGYSVFRQESMRAIESSSSIGANT